MLRAKLIEAREKKRLTQDQLAEQCNVDVATIRRWEHGESMPQGRNKWRLMEVLGASSEDDLGLARRRQEKKQDQDNHTALASLSRQGVTIRLIALVNGRTTISSREIIDLGSKIEQELETMNNKISRREAMQEAVFALIGLPLALHHLSPTNIVEEPTEEILRQCTAGITACQQLIKGNATEIAEASRALSSYLPSLKAIVKNSSKHRTVAARLVTQAYIQKAGIAIHLYDSRQAVKYAEQAMFYAGQSNDKIMEIAASSRLTWMLFGNQQHRLAMHQALATVHLSKEAEQAKIKIPALMQSALYGDAALYQAVNGERANAERDVHLASLYYQYARKDEPIYLAWDKDLLVLFEGRTRYFNGDAKAAYETISQVIDPDTFQLKTTSFSKDTRPQAINFLTQASLKLPKKDKEHSAKLWEAGLEATLTLKSEQRFGEVLTAYEMMSTLWPDDKYIAELRQRIIHW
ncbi:hypothetical protein KSF_087590 [Reticulibacter mediterranei]|uniref:HTH cro/C1-type domain-containing protein n=1 Tax=Reticulibacter mediterranei TaxID=2778369 RepID=A0A8J3IQ52_9CHLR|nr:helix-turn-helix transcriptional regulator [Reticulibacter mediterranei]GHO98711.1 hypothetical protein KSF_087590 [Reticulibacter mediterranei]